MCVLYNVRLHRVVVIITITVMAGNSFCEIVNKQLEIIFLKSIIAIDYFSLISMARSFVGEYSVTVSADNTHS